MKSLFLFSSLLVFCASTFAVEATKLYIATNGNDTNADGSETAPFATLAGAKAKLESLAKDKNRAQSPIEIIFKEGVYFAEKTAEFSKECGINEKSPLVIRGQEGKNVCIVGGKRIAASDLKEVVDASILKRLPDSLEGKVFELNLKKYGLNDYGKMQNVGFGRAYSPAQMEAFFNGEPLTLARYPNEGRLKIGDVLDAGHIRAIANGQGAYKPEPDPNIRGATFKYDYQRADRWVGVKDVWLEGIFSVGWADDRIQVKSIDAKNKTIVLEQPHIYGVMTCNYDPKKSHWKIRQDLYVRGYYALNLLEELDAVGEYYIDRDNGVFYVVLKEKPASGYFDFSTISTPIISLKGAEFITIENLTFSVGRDVALRGENLKKISVKNCTFRNMGGFGLMFANSSDIEKSNKEIHISDSKAYHNGNGGMSVGAGNRATLTQGNLVVENSEFYENSRIKRNYSPSLQISNTAGATVRHCYFHDQLYAALSYSANDLIVEMNYFERCCKDSSDMGVTYTGRDQSMQGIVFRYNIFCQNNPKNEFDHMNGIYIDDGSGGTLIEKNIFCRTGDLYMGAIFFHGGHDNEILQNVFIDCPTAAAHTYWDEKRWQAALVRERYRLKKNVDIESDTYLKKYPKLVNMLKENQLRINYMRNNWLFNSSMPTNGEWSLKSNHTLIPNEGKDVPSNVIWNIAEIQKYFGNDGIVKSILAKKVGIIK